MNSLLYLADSAVLLAAPQDTKGPEFGKASPIGLLVIVVLLVATFLLIRSMNKQLRKLPPTFDEQHPEADQAFDEGTDTVDDMAVTSSDVPTGDGTAPPRDQPNGTGKPID